MNYAEFLVLAKKQSKGRKFIIEILLFFAVFCVTSMASGLILEIPLLIDTLKVLMKTGDLLAALEAMTGFLTEQKYILIMLFATVLTTAGTVIFCTKIEKRSLASMGFVRRGIAKEYLLGLAVGTGLFAAAILICVIFGHVRIRFSGGSIGIILLFLLGYLLQGMSEEVLVRGYFMISAARRNSVILAMVSSSVIFSLLHIFNTGVTVLALVNIALFGFLMALYMMIRGDIWGACAIHSAWNFVQGNIFGVQVSGMSVCESLWTTEMTGSRWINGGSFGMEGGLAVTFVLVVTIGILLLAARKRNLSFKKLPEAE